VTSLYLYVSNLQEIQGDGSNESLQFEPFYFNKSRQIF